jgi:hypothetical protein
MRRAFGVGFGLLLGFALAASESSAARPDAVALRKDWAFARCLAKTASGQPAGDDAAKSAAALLERAAGRMEIFEGLERLAARYAARPYAGSNGTGYGTLKCLDLYHSRELDRAARGGKLGR